ncbi:hypothetical protein MM817_02681 [Acidibacillus sp. S0AB]|uniref:Uncharacterized protein n=1 Tax=Sulfoacidibacillus ferrooxidans TaxID=2005001 RepID=A0A9X1VBG1_9BACL|nr:hypothetical protein [Sulfoacidibacillus ferrooxidans]
MLYLQHPDEMLLDERQAADVYFISLLSVRDGTKQPSFLEVSIKRFSTALKALNGIFQRRDVIKTNQISLNFVCETLNI